MLDEDIVAEHPPPIAELIDRLRSDRAAFTLLYNRTAAKLFGIALRITGRKDIADDALQECFIAIWRRAADYDASRGDAMAWMMSIMRHTAIDRLRRLGARPDGHLVSQDLLRTMASDDRADRRTDLRSLERCLDELGKEAREAVLLAYLFGFSREELSARFGVPVGTVKSWIRRSLPRLQRCLEG